MDINVHRVTKVAPKFYNLDKEWSFATIDFVDGKGSTMSVFVQNTDEDLVALWKLHATVETIIGVLVHGVEPPKDEEE